MTEISIDGDITSTTKRGWMAMWLVRIALMIAPACDRPAWWMVYPEDVDD